MVGMIYVEIYNEKIRNLLAENDDANKGIKLVDVDGAFELQGVDLEIVNSVDQITKWLEKGDKKLATASTNMNEHSSRSHAILQL